MNLEYKTIQKWPNLAWVAVFANGTGRIVVYHGPMVETMDNWCVEAVWAGKFLDGDFDRTDLVFGTGVRCRNGRLLFVSSGSTLDRLCYCHKSGVWYVSNSLPALLATADLFLNEDYDYAEDLKTICGGLKSYKRTLPAESVDLKLLYFNNLIYDGQSIKEVDKPDAFPRSTKFHDYFGFLIATSERLADNMNADARSHRIVSVSSISSGYDSPAVAVIAKYAGCDQTVTIRTSTSLWRGSDSGETTAKHLNMACQSYTRTATYYPLEETIWAVVGRPGVLNWVLFEYPEPLCVFFTGCHGDKVWQRSWDELEDPFVMPSVAFHGIGEFRLFKGVFHCPIPYWGMRHVHEIREIGFSQEMESWTMHNDYDRPIVRRIIEEAGVPRGTFAVRKKNTSHEASFLWPYSSEARATFERYMIQRNLHVPPPWLVWLIRRAAQIDNLIYLNIKNRFGLKKKRRPWDRISCPSLLFRWANYEMKKRYKNGLKAEGIDPAVAVHGGRVFEAFRS